jgi:hypothetical protein
MQRMPRSERKNNSVQTKDRHSSPVLPLSLPTVCANADFVRQEGLGIRYMSFIPLPSGGRRTNFAARNKPNDDATRGRERLGLAADSGLVGCGKGTESESGMSHVTVRNCCSIQRACNVSFRFLCYEQYPVLSFKASILHLSPPPLHQIGLLAAACRNIPVSDCPPWD